MKRITFNIDEDLFNKLGNDKAIVNQKAKEILMNSFVKSPQLTTPNIESKPNRLVSQIKGYLKNNDSVYLHVLSNSHKRRQIKLNLEDL